MKEIQCDCGNYVKVSDDCKSVKCRYCCHNSIAKQIREEVEAVPEKKTVKKKKIKKYKCAKYNIKRARTTVKCNSCNKKTGCELWSLKKGKK